jgi:CopG family transcriptional regulator/antitoxin EndoAI
MSTLNKPALTYTLKVCMLRYQYQLTSAMSKRINIVLPDKTLAVLNRVAPKGNRSQLISRAVLQFIEAQGKQTLRQRLKVEALENAERDVAMAAEWFPLEEAMASRIPAAKGVKKSRKTKRS